MANGARRETTRENFWRRMIRGQAGSGLSIRVRRGEHSMHEASFYWWRKRLDRPDADRAEPAFVPVRLTEDSAASAEPAIEIVWARGPRVQVRGRVDRQALADVLAVLAEEASRGHVGQDETLAGPVDETRIDRARQATVWGTRSC